MTVDISVNLNDVAGRSFEFKSYSHIIEFFSNESLFWKEKKDSIVNQDRIYNFITAYSLLDQVVGLVQTYENMLDVQAKENFNSGNNKLRDNCQGLLNNNWLWSGHPYSVAFVECHKKYGIEGAETFLKLVQKGQIANNAISNRNVFSSLILGYEFLTPESELIKRSESEKASLEKLRNDLVKSKFELVTESEAIKSEFKKWTDETRINQEDQSAQVEKEHLLAKQTFEDKFEKFMASSREEIQALEKTYEKLLKLKEPAKHWKKASYWHMGQGIFWVVLLLTFLLIGAIKVIDCFNLWLDKKALAVELNTVQGVIIFGSALAIYAFSIRILTRLAFSNFHLMKDADERATLTYVYLSLIKEKAINENSANIVLQALFSRSETGLLGGDSSPTLPNAVSEMINRQNS